jgi:hypothetical protein
VGANWPSSYKSSQDGAEKTALHAAALSSLSAPRITILSASSGNGRCSALASSHGARIQTSLSSSVVRITGIALGWIPKVFQRVHDANMALINQRIAQHFADQSSCRM